MIESWVLLFVFCNLIKVYWDKEVFKIVKCYLCDFVNVFVVMNIVFNIFIDVCFVIILILMLWVF